MKVRFLASDPRRKARAELDALLSSGVDQLAIACAFLTGGGAELLRPHAQRLRLPNSFVVVAWEPPTSLEALETLHSLFPGNLYLHLGAQTPIERGVGRGLMHSKVFFARAENRCTLWTGSHNLTASASQGVNCEAAVLLEGLAEEQPFQDALSHLTTCRDEAVVFDPFNPPPPPTSRETLVIHAECHVGVSQPPWFVHLRPATIDYDKVMRPPAAVVLYLYGPGTLKPGVRRPAALAAYRGAITALNFTQGHPERGIPADWRDADYVIEQAHGVFRMSTKSPSNSAPTQGVLRIEATDDKDAVWVSDSPVPKLEKTVGAEVMREVDQDQKRFFTKASIRGGRLVHRQYLDMRPTYRFPVKEIGAASAEDLIQQSRLPRDARIEIEEGGLNRKFEFIYKARYRV